MGGPERLRPAEAVPLPPAGESEGVDVARTAAADQRERRQLAGQLARARLDGGPAATPAGRRQRVIGRPTGGQDTLSGRVRHRSPVPAVTLRHLSV